MHAGQSLCFTLVLASMFVAAPCPSPAAAQGEFYQATGSEIEIPAGTPIRGNAATEQQRPQLPRPAVCQGR